MREILFRGKAVKSGEWHYGMFCAEGYDADFPYILPYDKDEIDHGDWEIDPETVGQFTALLDKNGTKIFEGDIVKSSYDFDDPEDYAIELIVFEHCAWCTRQVGASDSDPRDDGDFEKWGVVIGNIHDNPELLENEAQ